MKRTPRLDSNGMPPRGKTTKQIGAAQFTNPQLLPSKRHPLLALRDGPELGDFVFATLPAIGLFK